MGSSPSAYLCFGIEATGEIHPLIPKRYLEEEDYGPYIREEFEDECLEEKYEDPVTLLLEGENIPDPYDDEPQPSEYLPWERKQEWLKENHPEWVARHDAYQRKKSNLEKAIPIEIISSGYNGETFYHVIALKGTVGDNCDYGVESIDLAHLMQEASPEKIEAARLFCERFELVEFRDPRWFLVTSYG